jgi:hypothetical protein
VNPTPTPCPFGTAFSDGACRLLDPCRGGLVRVGNACVAPNPDPKPPIVVINDPCARLFGGEFQRCIRGTPPTSIPTSLPTKGPVAGPTTIPTTIPTTGPTRVPTTGPTTLPTTLPTGTGGGRPVGNQTTPATGLTGHNPVGGAVGVTNITVTKPNVVFHPNGPATDIKTIKDPTPVSRLPLTTTTPMRTNPNPVVLGAGSGGISKTTVGASQPVTNNAIAQSRVLPMALPKQGTTQR